MKDLCSKHQTSKCVSVHQPCNIFDIQYYYRVLWLHHSNLNFQKGGMHLNYGPMSILAHNGTDIHHILLYFPKIILKVKHVGRDSKNKMNSLFCNIRLVLLKFVSSFSRFCILFSNICIMDVSCRPPYSFYTNQKVERKL